MEPVRTALAAAFRSLDYPEPELEARALLALIDGMATQYFLQEAFDVKAMIEFLKVKYKV
jgi:hypothetical protein